MKICSGRVPLSTLTVFLFLTVSTKSNPIPNAPRASLYLTLGMISPLSVKETPKSTSGHGSSYETKTGFSLGVGFDFRIYRPLSLGIAVDQGSSPLTVYNFFGSRIDTRQGFSSGSLMLKTLLPLSGRRLAIRLGAGPGFGYLSELLFEGWTHLMLIKYTGELIFIRLCIVQFEMIRVMSGANDENNVSIDSFYMIRVGMGF